MRDLIERLVEMNNYPLQVELHPGPHCGPFQCTYCYSKGQRLTDGLLSINDYSRLLDDLMLKPPFIEISGIGSDPLSYPDFYLLLKLIKERGFAFGIHTKGYFLNRELIKLLNTEPTKGTYITVGVDSATPSIYNELHGLPPKSNIYDMINKKIFCLYNEKMKRRSGLQINITYLLFNNNSSKEQIDKFIHTFRKHSDVVRFSIPQVPNMAEPVHFLDRKEIDETFELLRYFEDDNVAVLNFRESTHDENLQFCWAQRFNATIDKSGNVFPCPQVALGDYLNLRLGNIKERRFWDIWNSEERERMLEMSVKDMKCRVCDRKDENINRELSELLKTNRYCLINQDRKTFDPYSARR